MCVCVCVCHVMTMIVCFQSIKYNEEHSHGSLVALAIAITAIFAAVNFNKVYLTLRYSLLYYLYCLLQIYGLISDYVKKKDR